MKKLTVILTLAAFVFSAAPVFAQKGASERAQEKASDQAIFHRVTDWFATIGKSDEEKAQIKAERAAKRAAKRAEKEAKKAKEEMEDEAEEAKEKAEKAGKEMKKGAGNMKNKMKGMGDK